MLLTTIVHKLKIGPIGAALLLLLFALGAALAQEGTRPGNFDHFTTGFPLTGAHNRADCASCHLRGVFKGIPTFCGACHKQGSFVNATGRPVRHIATSENCGECHTTVAWAPVVRMDHNAVIGSCINCHNNAVEPGKPANHIRSGNNCDDCHNTSRWTPAVYDHRNITEACASCHNGTTATGKTPRHVITTLDCGSCHSTLAWAPASFNHNGITQPCSSCHNGSSAIGKTATHVITTSECSSCHTTNAWKPANFNHTNITQPCSTCHNGTTAPGPSTGHFVTPRECNYCHTTTNWTTLTFRHISPGYPGEHRQAFTCNNAACHGSNTEAVTWRYPAYSSSCAGCHAGNFKQSAHDETVSVLRNCNGSCHIQSVPRNGEHKVTDGNF